MQHHRWVLWCKVFLYFVILESVRPQEKAATSSSPQARALAAGARVFTSLPSLRRGIAVYTFMASLKRGRAFVRTPFPLSVEFLLSYVLVTGWP